MFRSISIETRPVKRRPAHAAPERNLGEGKSAQAANKPGGRRFCSDENECPVRDTVIARRASALDRIEA
jgi:hypothetical protein